jgi:hypothetical protein
MTKCIFSGCDTPQYGHSQFCSQHIGEFRNQPTTEAVKQTLASQYPKYYKAVPKGWDSMDTYAVNILFPVDDPSGCILHARKKLLVPGVRSGGKSMRKDITEARDTLNRWLELNPE